jgi:DNA-binding CsgD family transcriptional regulator
MALAMPTLKPSRLQLSHDVAAGNWPSDIAYRRWISRWNDLDVAQHSTLKQFLAQPQTAITLTREQLLNRPGEREPVFCEKTLVPEELYEELFSRRPVTAIQGWYLIVLLINPGDKPFRPRVSAFVDYVHELLAPHLGRELWLSTQPNLSALSRRLRQTLERLLAGDSERQAALALGISPATIREYVTNLYRHFGVASRSELLAHFLQRYHRSQLRNQMDEA